ncbi:hypothetical protein [Porphyromonas gingivicanis]|uniref:hypothetical protein n=1 Tax=Porphyromonas gingivicanis TaxID=266762 RepID=UPI00046EDF8F|nr:hypothetical protein [Porphyromonas gingivicanis]
MNRRRLAIHSLIIILFATFVLDGRIAIYYVEKGKFFCNTLLKIFSPEGVILVKTVERNDNL